MLQRELSVDTGTQVAGRALFAFVALAAFVIVMKRGDTINAFRTMGWAGLAVAVFTALVTVMGFGARAILGGGAEEAVGKGGNLAAPLLALGATARALLRWPGTFRSRWHALPGFVLTKLAWAWGAGGRRAPVAPS